MHYSAGGMTDERRNQRIVRLTALTEALAAIAAATAPLASRLLPLSQALGCIAANDVRSRRPVPPVALALRDGFAVAAEATVDAGAYAPAPLAAAWPIETGAVLPPGTDAVAAPDQVSIHHGLAQALAPVAPGDGVLAAGGDAALDAVLLPRGRRLCHRHLAALACAGIEQVSVRTPKVRIASARQPCDSIVHQAMDVIAAAVFAAGGKSAFEEMPPQQAMLEPGADTVLVIGGTGAGATDAVVATLAACGELKMHGVAISPGETAAFGIAGGRPVLALPGRLDSALAVFALLGRPLVERLAGSTEPPLTRTARLTRKVASALGIAELVPVRCEGGAALPIALGYVPLAALAQSDGWILVPPDSEGYAPDSEVVIRPWV
ncbi:MAG: molybdopterin-binding protein [Hyphomicrobiales bacterium]|nr:molybdopterin-binding protein [Hyphomicrobiales bacterium]